jgi:hypothetical protein
MAGNRTEPHHPGRSPLPPRQHGTDRDTEARQPGERCGPLAIARHRKGDGRALILYTDRRQRA